MNQAAAEVVVAGFLKGSFDVFDAMLSLSFKCEGQEMTDAATDSVTSALQEYPVVMRGRADDFGAVAMLFSHKDMGLILALLEGSGEDAKDEVAEGDLATLQEIAEPFLGGGVTNLLDKFGRTVEPVQDCRVELMAADKAQELLDFTGQATLASVDFAAPPEVQGNARLLYSQEIEGRVPEDILGEKAGGSNLAEEPQLSQGEMQDILSGFEPTEGDVDSGESAPRGGSGGQMPENLEMIMDIGLVVTARLGSVELPIQEVLSLGPGSIIEVGHVVDEPVELLINDKLVARGEVVMVDEKFGLRITEIVSARERIESMR